MRDRGCESKLRNLITQSCGGRDEASGTVRRLGGWSVLLVHAAQCSMRGPD